MDILILTREQMIDLGLAGIFPMADEETGAEPKVVSASFADPYLLVIRDDSSMLLLCCDTHGDLDEVERSPELRSARWSSGSLYLDSRKAFSSISGQKEKNKQDTTFMFLLSTRGGMHVSSPIHCNL